MSFYGQHNNITETHFQFDKIYPSRQAMDAELISGQDNIFAGRFVLVNYNDTDILSLPNVQIGYKITVSGVSNFYQDINGNHPFEYTNFISFAAANVADPPAAEVYENYYFKKDNYFFKMPSDPEYYSASNRDYYYVPENTNSSAIVGEGWIIREYYNEAFTGDFYRCSGAEEGTNKPIWERLGNSNEYVFSYLTNYRSDKDTYGDAFDDRGYNATVWQKIYSDGVGRFILIARLECSPPQIVLYPEAPSMDPVAPYLDASSTDQLYKIHVPAHWGLQIKEIETSVSDDEDELEDDGYNKSDQYLNDVGDYADVYLNLGGPTLGAVEVYHKNQQNKDLTTKNEVLLTPTGKSGRLYNGVEKEDILELSIHLPVVGNMIDEGYDLIYGSDTETGKRARDIQWYNGDQNELKINGSPELGGKTYDLNTLAGTLNEMHTRLGQIIIPLSSRSQLNLETLNDNDKKYIYYIQDEDIYCRIGLSYQYDVLTDSTLNYDFVEVSFDDIEYTTDTYYVRENGEYIKSTGIDTNNPPEYLYEKRIKEEMYHKLDNPALMAYTPSTYFWKMGSDYILERSNQPSFTPEYPAQPYYTITDPQTSQGHVAGDGEITSDIECFPGSWFQGSYQGSTYYYIDSKDNYILDRNNQSTSGREYYTPNFAATTYEGVIYEKNRFYYFDEEDDPDHEKPILCTWDTLTDLRAFFSPSAPPRNLYWLKFDTSKTLIYTLLNEDNELVTIYGHPLMDDEYGGKYAILLASMLDPGTTIKSQLYWQDGDGSYIAFKNLDYSMLSNDGTPLYAESRLYRRLTGHTKWDRLYVANKYYINTDPENNIMNPAHFEGDYILSSTLDASKNYYLLKHIDHLTQPFYVPGVYYYEYSDNIFEIDVSSSMTAGRDYYSKDRLFVINDSSGHCPYGYEWNNYSVFIPASITLGRRTESLSFIQIKNFADGLQGSINSYLLQLENYLEVDNEDIRDKDTVKGALNLVQDYLYILGHLIPRRMLFVNDFGQIECSSIDVLQLKDIMTKYNEIMNL